MDLPVELLGSSPPLSWKPLSVFSMLAPCTKSEAASESSLPIVKGFWSSKSIAEICALCLVGASFSSTPSSSYSPSSGCQPNSSSEADLF